MAANSIGLTYTELRRWIGREIGKDRDPSNWDAISTADAGDILKAGLRQFYFQTPGGYVWSFLQPTLAELVVRGVYSTGTVGSGGGSGEVVLSDGVWPDWASLAELWVGGQRFSVSSRTNNSYITVGVAAPGVTAGSSYELIQREYALPDDFGGMVEPFTYRQDQYQWRPLTRINEALMRQRDQYPRCTSPPEYFSIGSVAPVLTTGHQESKSLAMFSPMPVTDVTLWYRYAVVPPMLDGTTSIYAYGGAEFTETLLLSCLDKALQTMYSSNEKHGAYLESLQASIERDKRMNRPQTHGFGVFSDGYTRGFNDPRALRSRTAIDTSNL